LTIAINLDVSAYYFFLLAIVFCLITSPTPGFPDNPKTDDTSLGIKIGQMIIVGFRGLTVDNQSPVVQDIAKRHIFETISVPFQNNLDQ